jgi:chemotaxis-related protein WspD
MDDCWNRIGVRGDRSCPELQRRVHCHNCPVYSNAARTLLDRDPPATPLVERTAQSAAPKPVIERGAHSVVLFRIGTEWLGLPTSVVLEAADRRPIHSLPHRQGGIVLGLANIRGELLVCVSLAQVLGLTAGGEDHLALRASPQRLLVIRRGEIRAVCPADEVQGIHRFHSRDLQEVPSTVARATATYSKAVVTWGRYPVGLLDEHLLFQALHRNLT